MSPRSPSEPKNAFGCEQRERWHPVSRHFQHRRPFDGAEGVGTVYENSQLPVSYSVFSPRPTCSTPSGRATPNYLTSRLASSDRGRNCRRAPAAMSLLHAMPTQIGRHFVPLAVRGSTSRRAARALAGTRPACQRKAGLPFLSPSRPISVWVMGSR